MGSIILAGHYCSGKTTVGMELAKQLQLPFIDTDDLLKQKIGELRVAWQRLGEEKFRDEESKVVADLCMRTSSAIIALGGGTALRSENIDQLAKIGKIFFLNVSPNLLIWRLHNKKGLPAMVRNDEEFGDLCNKRQAIYDRTKHYMISTDGLSVKEIASMIATHNV